METTARLNPGAPLFIPVHRFHFPPPITTTLHFPPPITTTLHFPPPPPPSFPHQNHTHFLYICPPVLQKPPPPPHLLPPPTEVLHSDAYHSTVRVDSVVKLITGPRFRSKEEKFRGGGRGRKKGIQPEKGVDLNEGMRIPKFGDWNSRERKCTGSRKVVWAKKSIFDGGIIPLREDEKKTTVMIKNIPSKYTREMLMQFLDKHCNEENERAKDMILSGDEAVSAYDFVYLPIDFFSRLNKGYAFVNFTNPNSVWKFRDAFNGKSWEYYNSPKRIDIVSAKIQGREALVDHFERSHFCCDTDEYLPLVLDPPRDGSGAPVKPRPIGNRFSPRHRSLGFNRNSCG